MDSPSADFFRAVTRVGDFDLHVRPNAFGLFIANVTRHWEFCAGGEMRGGDCGGAACGGMGVLYGWLPLASSYRQPYRRNTARYVRRTVTIPA